MPDTRKHLRLKLPVGLAHIVRQWALREGRSESTMVSRLVGEAIDHRNAATREPSNEMKRLAALLSEAISTPAPAE